MVAAGLDVRVVLGGPDLPGIGFEGKTDLYSVMRQLGEPALAL